jgi:DNA polymerase-4
MDAFLASIEQRDDPGLRGKPVAVGGGGKRGVVAAASYEAREYGVRSAMPTALALQRCPDLRVVKPRFSVYKEVSGQIRALFEEYTDLVEPLSLDEAFLDLTQPKKGPPSGTLLAKEIRRRIYEETGLTASAGISFNKFLAKIASDLNKPNGQALIAPEEALVFLERLPIEKFFGVGKKTAEKMKKLGIFTGKDLKSLSEIELVQRFGKVGRHFYHMVRAEDQRPVNPNRIRKSIGAERTFSDNIAEKSLLLEKLDPLIEQVFRVMDQSENYGRTVTLKMKTPDFRIHTRSRTYPLMLESRAELSSAIHRLLDEHWHPEMPLRLIGLSVSSLRLDQPLDGGQLRIRFREEE